MDAICLAHSSGKSLAIAASRLASLSFPRFVLDTFSSYLRSTSPRVAGLCFECCPARISASFAAAQLRASVLRSNAALARTPRLFTSMNHFPLGSCLGSDAIRQSVRQSFVMAAHPMVSNGDITTV